MKIVIFTSKDHVYGNFLLLTLFRSGIFRKHLVYVFEQDAIVPGKSKWQGIMRYLEVSGMHYVVIQAVKQWLFLLLRSLAAWHRNTDSVFYPYWIGNMEIKHRAPQGNIKTQEVYAHLSAIKPDILVSLFSKEIIPQRILDLVQGKAVNVHPALLPSFRGVSPIFWAFSQNVRHVGITLHYLDRGIDTGGIIAQKEFYIQSKTNEHAVYMELTRLGTELVSGYLKKIFAGKLIRTLNIRSKEASYYSLPTKSALQALYSHGYGIFSLPQMIYEYTHKHV